MSQINTEERQEFLKYETFLNEVVGVLAFALGLQCLGFDDLKYWWIFSKKAFFALVSFVFIIVILFSKQKQVKVLLLKMKETKHPYIDSWLSIFRIPSYFIALAFLFLIAFGCIK